MKSLTVILTLGLYITTVVGDHIVFRSKYTDSRVFRALSDNAVHASIGFLSALIFFSYDVNISSQACLCNIALCTMVASVIDVDHFLVARSFFIKDLSGLKQRGILHCTSFFLAITAVMFIYSYLYKKSNIFVATWMLVIAYLSHHIRDANRRGLWLYPFGHTPAINTYFYIFLIVLLPHIFYYLNVCIKPFITKQTVIRYNYYRMLTV